MHFRLNHRNRSSIAVRGVGPSVGVDRTQDHITPYCMLHRIRIAYRIRINISHHIAFDTCGHILIHIRNRIRISHRIALQIRNRIPVHIRVHTRNHCRCHCRYVRQTLHEVTAAPGGLCESSVYIRIWHIHVACTTDPYTWATQIM